MKSSVRDLKSNIIIFRKGFDKLKELKSKLTACGLAGVLALSFVLAGCGDTSENSNDSKQTSSSSAKDTENNSRQESLATSENTESSTEAIQELQGVFPKIAGENGTVYRSLFEVILDKQYDDYWIEKCESIVGKEKAEESAKTLKEYISADIYGQEAIDTYAKSNAPSFDCWYISNAYTFEFKGDQITVTLKDGTSETHTYEYQGVYKVGEGETMEYNGQTIDPSFDCDVYKSTDDAGEFTYFFLRDDTMDKTYHIEFRYGSDLKELQGYFVGKYAYWLSAGIDKDADEKTVHNVIDLFITENLSGE